jgi:hypothetical protein
METLSREDAPASGGRDVLTQTPAAQRAIRQGHGARRLRLRPEAVGGLGLVRPRAVTNASQHHFAVESAAFTLVVSGTTATALSFQTVTPRRRTTR